MLEIGTGEGRLIWGYGAAARRVVGVDPDPEAIALAREHARGLGWRHVTFRADAAQDLELGRERFDVAIFSWSL